MEEKRSCVSSRREVTRFIGDEEGRLCIGWSFGKKVKKKSCDDRPVIRTEHCEMTSSISANGVMNDFTRGTTMC